MAELEDKLKQIYKVLRIYSNFTKNVEQII